jgi:SAM-dependent methyltransferase
MVTGWFGCCEVKAMSDLEFPNAYQYALATGDKAAPRLALLQSVYGADAERILATIGISQGDHVADFGCGTGATIPWFAKQVGPTGEVLGLDASAAQLAIARQNCIDAGLTNVRLVESDVYATGLPRDTFDAVHCRLLLCHLQRPADAIQEMADVVRPGGVVVCFDLDLDGLFTMPPTDCYDQLRQLYIDRRRQDGLDSALAAKVPSLMMAAGLAAPEMAFIHPVYLRGEKKRLWEFTFTESAERTLAKKLISPNEFERLMEQVSAVARDDHIAVAQARMPVFWARKPG